MLSARRLFPPNVLGKLAVAGLFAFVLAGCGGGGSKAQVQTVTASDYRFEAPADWKITRAATATTASSGDELVSVTIFRLPRPFRPTLWKTAVPELDRVAAELAGALGGHVTAQSDTVVAGKRTRRYDIGFTRDGKELVERLGFLFDGRREYQLLCRYPDDDAACRSFFASFKLV